MIVKALLGALVMALCVTIHAVGLLVMLRKINRAAPLADLGAVTQAWIIIRIAAWLILLHLVEISAWAMLYYFLGATPDLDTALYFSSETYTTVGYGDVVLSREWNLVVGVEALTGILMCGWSTGFFFLPHQPHLFGAGRTRAGLTS
jgi:Ion channel.